METIGDKKDVLVILRRGLPEGSPLSPAVYNTYIDPLAFAYGVVAFGDRVDIF